jgi:hypothetical protein
MAALSELWNAPTAEWDAALESYVSALQEKALDSSRGTLVDDDKRLFESWASQVLAREPPHLSKDDLIFVNLWKLQRGSFRPGLAALIAQNEPEDVIKTSTKALSMLASPGLANDALCALRGVGPATASAIQAALCPEDVPFMSDQLLQAVAGKGETISYTKKSFLSACKAALNKSAELGNDWTPRNVEAAVFAHAIHHPTLAERAKRARKRAAEAKKTNKSAAAEPKAGKRPARDVEDTVEVVGVAKSAKKRATRK